MESNRLIPLLILFVVVAILAVVGFVAWNIMMAVTAQTKKEMEKKNVSMSRDGMTVGVRELNDEEYKDISQGYAYLFSLFGIFFIFSSSSSWSWKKGVYTFFQVALPPFPFFT